MIITENGHVLLNGDKAGLLADLTCIIKHLMKDEGIEKGQILKSVELSTMTREELKQELIDELFECIKGMAKGKE